MTIIFPHVPKCGGTSLQKQIETLSGNVFMDYDCPPAPDLWSKRNCERRNEEFALLDFSPFAIVFGHFPIQRYQSDKYRYVTLVRDPLDRIFSHYRHLIERAGKNAHLHPNVKKMEGLLLSNAITLSEWAIRSGLVNIYEKYLSYWPKERFTLVGDISNYGDFAERLSGLLEHPIDGTIRERMGAPMEIPIEPKDLQRLKKLLANDYRWYESFIS